MLENERDKLTTVLEKHRDEGTKARFVFLDTNVESDPAMPFNEYVDHADVQWVGRTPLGEVDCLVAFSDSDNLRAHLDAVMVGEPGHPVVSYEYYTESRSGNGFVHFLTSTNGVHLHPIYAAEPTEGATEGTLKVRFRG